MTPLITSITKVGHQLYLFWVRKEGVCWLVWEERVCWMLCPLAFRLFLIPWQQCLCECYRMLCRYIYMPREIVFLFWLQHNVWQQPPLAPKWVTKGLLLFSLFPPPLLFISFFGFGYFFLFCVWSFDTNTACESVFFFSPLLCLSFLELGCRKLLASFVCGVIKVSVYFQRGIFVVITTSTDITRHTYWNSKQ